MIQFTAQDTDRFSLAETAQMALEGGCRWIEMQFGDDADEAAIREVAQETADLCEEAKAFLVIRDRVDDAKALQLHGVFLSHGGLKAAVEAREKLGPEAVVGFMAHNSQDIADAVKYDIDYAALEPSLGLAEAQEMIEKAHSLGECAPIVATCPVTTDNLYDLIAVGYNGMNVQAQDLKDDITADVNALMDALP